MKKQIILISFLLFFYVAFAQTADSLLVKPDFQPEILKLNNEIKFLEKSNSYLQQINATQKKQIDSIILQLSTAQSNIQEIADSLHITIKSISSNNKQTQSQIQDINQTITNRTLYWIIAILTVALLSLVVFLVLRNKLSSNAKNIDLLIEKNYKTLQSDAIKLDSKFVDILHNQLSLLKVERKEKGSISSEADHKLPLKVGEEIHRMRKRIENMPQEIRGLSALTNSLQRLEEEFNESGYELQDLLGQKYVDGMKLEARFVDNPNTPKGEEIITNVLRPQIMYKGLVIQVAKVEVSKSY
jgi:hypothetical protein